MYRIIPGLITVVVLVLIFHKDPVILCRAVTYVAYGNKGLALESDIYIDLAEVIPGFDRDQGVFTEALPEQIMKQRIKYHQSFRLDLFTDIAAL